MRNNSLRTIFDLVSKQFSLSKLSDHGPDHWHRVEEVGLELAKETNADTEIISMFALLHDSRRIYDVIDPEHGKRSAEFVQHLSNSDHIKLDKDRLETLIFACRHHNDRSAHSDNLTVNICWDSDKVDLIRIGVDPKDIVLTTEVGIKYLQNIIHANENKN